MLEKLSFIIPVNS